MLFTIVGCRLSGVEPAGVRSAMSERRVKVIVFEYDCVGAETTVVKEQVVRTRESPMLGSAGCEEKGRFCCTVKSRC
jgi:hypothetical protein